MQNSHCLLCLVTLGIILVSCKLFTFRKKKAFAPHLFFFSKVTSSFIELFVQGTEDTELTLTREGDYVGSTDDFAEVSTIELILPKYL